MNSSLVKRRWGIVGLAVAMFFVTMIVTSINGSKTSIYYCVWIAVGYYGFKNNLESIRVLMKVLIWINLLITSIIILFFDDSPINYIFKGVGKIDLIFSIFILLIPKILLFLYAKSQLGMLNTNDLIGTPKSNVNTDNTIYENILNEYEDVNYQNKGLYARLYAKFDGDEKLIKSNYIQIRFDEIKQATIQEHEKTIENTITEPNQIIDINSTNTNANNLENINDFIQTANESKLTIDENSSINKNQSKTLWYVFILTLNLIVIDIFGYGFLFGDFYTLDNDEKIWFIQIFKIFLAFYVYVLAPLFDCVILYLLYKDKNPNETKFSGIYAILILIYGYLFFVMN